MTDSTFHPFSKEETSPEAIELPDPFDPQSRKLDPSSGNLPTKKLITTIPVRKPGKMDWVRVRPEPEYQLRVSLLDVREDKEIYMVPPAMRGELAGEYAPYAVYTAMTRRGTLFLWLARLPGDDGKDFRWFSSLREAAEYAQTSWVRVLADQALGAYVVTLSEAKLSEPVWPELEMRDILKIAFGRYIVDNLDHPLVKSLRGLV